MNTIPLKCLYLIQKFKIPKWFWKKLILWFIRFSQAPHRIHGAKSKGNISKNYKYQDICLSQLYYHQFRQSVFDTFNYLRSCGSDSKLTCYFLFQGTNLTKARNVYLNNLSNKNRSILDLSDKHGCRERRLNVKFGYWSEVFK